MVQDPFTSYYDAQVVADFVRLAEKIGYQPVVLPFSPNGKAQHIKGFLTRFAKTAQKTSDFLNRVAQLGMPMVGVDPALVLCYRDEYKQTLGDKRGDFQVLLVHEWLPAVLTQTPLRRSAENPVPVWALHRSDGAADGACPVGFYLLPVWREAGKRQRGLLRYGRNLRP